jgi:hypothetical protein
MIEKVPREKQKISDRLVFFNFGSVFDLPPGGGEKEEEEEGRGEKKIMNGLLSLISFSSVPDYAPCSFLSTLFISRHLETKSGSLLR